MIWFWTIYISIGLYVLMPGLVYAWETSEFSLGIKIVGAIVSVLIWPVVFIDLGE
jgi:hypothetical protein